MRITKLTHDNPKTSGNKTAFRKTDPKSSSSERGNNSKQSKLMVLHNEGQLTKPYAISDACIKSASALFTYLIAALLQFKLI